MSRPEAAVLLKEACSPDRRFDAVVIGEYERAFSGGVPTQRHRDRQISDDGCDVAVVEVDGLVQPE